MKYFITGCAGFIGSNLADRLLEQGHKVVGYDNLSTGQEKFIDYAKTFKEFEFIKGDILDSKSLTTALQGCDFVFHLAANADVRFGLNHPFKDLEQNTIATFNVLEAMRTNGIGKIAFASTGSIYGEPETFPTPETVSFPVQTSLYGSSKLAGEGLVQAYCEGYNYKGYIFRFVSILGERYSHGHVFDFYQKLSSDEMKLHILGDGHQRKSYLYIQDCIDAMLTAIERSNEKINIFNLGVDEYCEVNDSVGWITEYLNLSPKLSYEGGQRGWIGDSPFIFLDCSKIKSLGWKPKQSIKQGIIKTVEWIKNNKWILETRK
ncbi:NAD-dependent epimerase/dehydratase family protein [bacterium]